MSYNLAEIERKTIVDVLRVEPSVVKAAKLLGIGKTTLYRKLIELGIAVHGKRCSECGRLMPKSKKIEIQEPLQ